MGRAGELDTRYLVPASLHSPNTKENLRKRDYKKHLQRAYIKLGRSKDREYKVGCVVVGDLADYVKCMVWVEVKKEVVERESCRRGRC